MSEPADDPEVLRRLRERIEDVLVDAGVEMDASSSWLARQAASLIAALGNDAVERLLGDTVGLQCEIRDAVEFIRERQDLYPEQPTEVIPGDDADLADSGTPDDIVEGERMLCEQVRLFLKRHEGPVPCETICKYLVSTVMEGSRTEEVDGHVRGFLRFLKRFPSVFEVGDDGTVRALQSD